MGSQCNGGYARVGSKLSTLWVGRVSDGRVVNRQSTHTTSQYKKYDERPGTVGAGARAAGVSTALPGLLGPSSQLTCVNIYSSLLTMTCWIGLSFCRSCEHGWFRAVDPLHDGTCDEKRWKYFCCRVHLSGRHLLRGSPGSLCQMYNWIAVSWRLRSVGRKCS